MCQATEAKIKSAATKARNLLGQLGPLVWALHSHHDCVALAGVALATDPGTHVRVRVPDPEDLTRKHAIDDILALTGGVDRDRQQDLFSSKELREVINRSIVVYAVAVLEQFLDEAGHPAYSAKGGRDTDWKLSFAPRCKALSCVDINLYCCDHYAEAALLALYRHKIVHVDARVDQKLVCQVAGLEAETDRQLQFRLSDDESSVVWAPCGGEKLCSSWTCKRLSLAVDEVLLPLLRDSQAFVREAEGILLEHTRNCPPGSASPG